MTLPNYFIDKWNYNLDTSINYLNANNIITTDLSFNDVNGIFKSYIDNSKSIILGDINDISTSLSQLDISIDSIYNQYIDISENIEIIDISTINISSRIITNYDPSNLIDDSFNNINNKINNIINNDTSFNGKITFNDDVTISGNLIGPNNFSIQPNNSNTVIINGNLQVDGSMTVINSTSIDISSETIKLDGSNIGLEIYNKNGENPSILYNKINDTWDINTNVDISGKLNVKNNDLRLNINDDSSNNKFEIIVGENNTVFLEGDLEISGNLYSNGDFIYEQNSKIDISNLIDINNDKIYSLYFYNNYITPPSTKNNNYGFGGKGYNIYFTDKSYNEIINDNSNNMTDFLKKYNMINLASTTDFSNIISYNLNHNFYEVSFNKIKIKQTNANYKLNLKIKLDISLSKPYGNYYIDFALLKYNNNDINPSNIIESIKKDISNVDNNTNIDISFNFDKISIKHNEPIGLGFLIYCKNASGSGINNLNLDANKGGIISNRTENSFQSDVTQNGFIGHPPPFIGWYDKTSLNSNLLENTTKGFKAKFWNSGSEYYIGHNICISSNHDNANNLYDKFSPYNQPRAYDLMRLFIVPNDHGNKHLFYFNSSDISENVFEYNCNPPNTKDTDNYIIKVKKSGKYNLNYKIKGQFDIPSGCVNKHVWVSDSQGRTTHLRDRKLGIHVVFIKNADTSSPELIKDINNATIFHKLASNTADDDYTNVGPLHYDFFASKDIYLSTGDTISIGMLYFYMVNHDTHNSWHAPSFGINHNKFSNLGNTGEYGYYFTNGQFKTRHDQHSYFHITYDSGSLGENDISINFTNVNFNLEKNILNNFESVNIDSGFNANNMISNDISCNNIIVTRDFSCNSLNIKTNNIIFKNLPVYSTPQEASVLENWQLWRNPTGEVYININ